MNNESLFSILVTYSFLAIYVHLIFYSPFFPANFILTLSRYVVLDPVTTLCVIRSLCCWERLGRRRTFSPLPGQASIKLHKVSVQQSTHPWHKLPVALRSASISQISPARITNTGDGFPFLLLYTSLQRQQKC